MAIERDPVAAASEMAASTLTDDLAEMMRAAGGRLMRDWELSIALIVLLAILILAVFGPWLIWPLDPLKVDVAGALQPPSAEHPMGTDSVGRDVFARFNSGAGISFMVGVAVAVVGGLVGGFIGIIAALARGWVDTVLMRLMDSILAFPPLVLAMAVTVGLGLGLVTAGIGIALTSVPYYARLLRSDVIRIRSLQFIEAANAIGASRTRIILRHVVPHTVSTLLIQAAALFGYSILTLAALGFVGLGAQIPTPEWGAMITDGLQYALTGQWWIGVFPGIGLLILVATTSILADKARDILDPRGKYAQL